MSNWTKADLGAVEISILVEDVIRDKHIPSLSDPTTLVRDDEKDFFKKLEDFSKAAAQLKEKRESDANK